MSSACGVLRRWALTAAAVVIAASTVGCAQASKYMREVEPPSPISPPPHAALVVFMRPSNYGGGDLFHVVDGERRFLGEVTGKQYFALALPPGAHTFVAWAENADMMQATLAPGRVYYVLLGARMGVWGVRLSISGLTPRRDEWEHVLEWLEGSTQMRSDTRAGQAGLDAEEVRERIGDAVEAWQRLDAPAHAVRTLAAEDGMGAPPL